MMIELLTPLQVAQRAQSQTVTLPGIQRFFKWDKKKICLLFDSITRGYPIGELLAWKVKPVDQQGLKFRLIDAHVMPGGTPKYLPSSKGDSYTWALLDGQQRTTSLLAGLFGSINGEELYIDLDSDAEAGDDPNAEIFDYKFKRADTYRVNRQNKSALFPIRQVAAFKKPITATNLNALLEEAEIDATKERRDLLRSVVQRLRDTPSVPIRTTQPGNGSDVLNVFSRLNTGGTKLTYVDLLISTATVQWPEGTNAIAAFNELKTEMNKVGRGFAFDETRIVKCALAALALNGTASLTFDIAKFLNGKVAKAMHPIWDDFAKSLVYATELLAEFGLDRQSLASSNVVVPVAAYVYKRKLHNTAYLTAASHAADRARVRAFVARTMLLRPAYFTGAVDAMLKDVVSTIKSCGNSFPLAEIEKKLYKTKFPISEPANGLADLMTMRYTDKRVAPCLRLLASVDGNLKTGVEYATDHIYAQTLTKVASGKIADPYRSAWLTQSAAQLPNLQLLTTSENSSKNSTSAHTWWSGLSPARKAELRRTQAVTSPPKLTHQDTESVKAYWDDRRIELETRLRKLMLLPTS